LIRSEKQRFLVFSKTVLRRELEYLQISVNCRPLAHRRIYRKNGYSVSKTRGVIIFSGRQTGKLVLHKTVSHGKLQNLQISVHGRLETHVLLSQKIVLNSQLENARVSDNRSLQKYVSVSVKSLFDQELKYFRVTVPGRFQTAIFALGEIVPHRKS
jgi:hypothetical protein